MKKKLPVIVAAIAAALIVIILIVTCIGPFLSRRASIEEQFRIAAEYIAELDYESALLAFNRVLEIDPKNVEAYLKIADIHIVKEDPDAAMQALQTALEVSSPIEFAITLIRIANELTVSSDIIDILGEAGLLDDPVVQDIVAGLVTEFIN